MCNASIKKLKPTSFIAIINIFTNPYARMPMTNIEEIFHISQRISRKPFSNEISNWNLFRKKSTKNCTCSKAEFDALLWNKHCKHIVIPTVVSRGIYTTKTNKLGISLFRPNNIVWLPMPISKGIQ